MNLRYRVKSAVSGARRFLDGLARPSPGANARRLQERGETLASFTIREATAADIPALARLHVKTFNETHGGGLTYEIREWQYRQKFADTDGSWFCYIVLRHNGDLAGFAVGEPGDFENYGGRLNKLYLLREYQRLGVGRRLVGHVTRHFLGQGISSMMLFSQVENPSIAFFDALGGERILGDTGDFGGAYGWRDLEKLASICPIE